MRLVINEPVERMDRPYARRWWALLVLCLSLLIIVMANTALTVAAPDMTRDLGLSSADLQWVIDGYTVPYAALMLLLGAIGDKYSRPRRARAGAGGLRRRRGGGLARGQFRRGHRGPRRDGGRRRADHARDALPARRYLPARGTREGDHPVDRHGRTRHRGGPPGRGRAAAAPRLVLHLPDQRADRRARDRRRPRPRTALQGRPPAPRRPRRRPAVGRLDRLPGLHDHRGAALRMGRPGRHGRGRRGARAGGLRGVGAAPPAPGRRRTPVRPAPVRRLQPRRRALLPGRLRRLLLPHPAPAVRARIRRARHRRADAAARRGRLHAARRSPATSPRASACGSR